MRPHRVLFLGQKKIGERCFEFLASQVSDTLDIRAAVTNASNDVWWESRGVWELANQLKVKCLDNRRRNNKEIFDLIISEQINTVISVQHPWILAPDILQYVSYKAYNFHNAKLPDYKGHNCCNHAILNEESLYTVTLHQMAAEVDAGFLISEKSFHIQPDETAYSLYARANEHCFEMFREFVDQLKKGQLSIGQPIRGGGTFYPRNSLDNLRTIYDISDKVKVSKLARALYFPPFKPLIWKSEGRELYIKPLKAEFEITMP
jgi:methionyl-tRNA formyltransferase